MTNLESLKKSLDDISSTKNHVISQEALFAKAVTEEDALQKREEDIARVEKQAQLMQEFNRSIALLMQIFKESRFDAVFSMVAEPARLLLINFITSIVRGMGFVIGASIIALVISSFFPGFFSF